MALIIQHHECIVRPEKPVTEHAEYPKHMTHPGYAPAVAAQPIPGDPQGRYTHGSSERFPAVLVSNADDEEYYAAKGYVSVGKSDPAAFARAVAAAQPAQTNYKPVEYPKWAGGVLVNSAEEETAALAARRGQLAPPPVDAAPGAEPALVTYGTPAPLPTGPSEVDVLRDEVAGKFDGMNAQLSAITAMLAKLTAPAPITEPEPAPVAEIPDWKRKQQERKASRSAA
jgi:hypothetical protein